MALLCQLLKSIISNARTVNQLLDSMFTSYPCTSPRSDILHDFNFGVYISADDTHMGYKLLRDLALPNTNTGRNGFFTPLFLVRTLTPPLFPLFLSLGFFRTGVGEAKPCCFEIDLSLIVVRSYSNGELLVSLLFKTQITSPKKKPTTK